MSPAATSAALDSFNQIATVRIELRDSNPVIWRQVEVFGHHLLLAIVAGAVDRDLARGTVDQDFHRMLERRALLHQVVAQEPEVTALGKDGGFVVDRAIPEVEHQSAGYPIATGDLNEITIGEGVSRERAQNQKTVDHTLGVANSNRLRGHRSWLKQCGAGYQNSERGGPNTFYHPNIHKLDFLFPPEALAMLRHRVRYRVVAAVSPTIRWNKRRDAAGNMAGNDRSD